MPGSLGWQVLRVRNFLRVRNLSLTASAQSSDIKVYSTHRTMGAEAGQAMKGPGQPGMCAAVLSFMSSSWPVQWQPFLSPQGGGPRPATLPYRSLSHWQMGGCLGGRVLPGDQIPSCDPGPP